MVCTTSSIWHVNSKQIRQGTESSFSESDNPWRQIDRIYDEIKPYGAYSTLLNASPYRGAVTALLHKIHNYLKLEEGEDGSALAEEIKTSATKATADDQVIYLQALIDDYEKFKGTTLPQSDAGTILANTLFRASARVEAWLENPTADILSNIARRLMNDYDESVRLNQQYGKEIAKYNEEIALAAFQVFGNQLPPDATFTLRFSDGRVKSVEYGFSHFHDLLWPVRPVPQPQSGIPLESATSLVEPQSGAPGLPPQLYLD